MRTLEAGASIRRAVPWGEERREGLAIPIPHKEHHLVDRIAWLRAAVLGANDGILSTAALMAGVGAASAGRQQLLVTGVAGLVAGAMSMAAGEYVSVSSQADSERAELEVERAELAAHPETELKELAGIYVARGLTPDLAAQVAEQLTAHDALGSHVRDELGVTEVARARPLQAALTSGASFSAGAALPILVTLFAPLKDVVPTVAGSSLVFLTLLGAFGARAGGAPVVRASVRTAILGALAMAAATAVGKLFGVAA